MATTDMPQSSIAVFIDYENLALGTGKRKRNGHQEPGPAPDVKLILERLVDKGRIPDRAYTGKNSADIRLAVDAVEMCLTKDHIDTFAILSGDSDFSPLVSKLKEFGKTVIGVGMKESTSSLLAEVCDEFIFYEDLTRSAGIPDFSQKVPKEKQPCYQLLFETIDALQRESDSFILASRLKDTMRRKRPQFSEGSFGYRSFTALIREAAKLGFIDIHQDPKSGTVVVDGFHE